MEVGTVSFRMRGHLKASWSSGSWKTGTEFGTVSFQMRGHFRLEGKLKSRQLEDGLGGWECLISDARSQFRLGRPVGGEAAGRRARRLGLSRFGCEVSLQPWKASWS